MPRTSLRVSRLGSQIFFCRSSAIRPKPDNVAFLESRKRRVDGFGGAVTLEGGQRMTHGVNCRALGFRRVNSDPVAHFLQPFHRQHRGFAAFEDIDQEGHAGQAARNVGKFLLRLGRFDEDRVDAELGEGAGALDGVIEAIDAARVGARDNEKSGAVRAARAALNFASISARDMTSLPSRWPQRLGVIWSSIWMAATPTRSNSRTVRTKLTALP